MGERIIMGWEDEAGCIPILLVHRNRPLSFNNLKTHDDRWQTSLIELQPAFSSSTLPLYRVFYALKCLPFSYFMRHLANGDGATVLD